MNRQKIEQIQQNYIVFFASAGLAPQSLITKPQLILLLDHQAKKYHSREFTTKIVDEVWAQSEPNSKGQTTVLNIAKIMGQAAGILQERLRLLENHGGIPKHQQELVREERELARSQELYYKGFQKSYDKVNQHRSRANVLQGSLRELQNNKNSFEQQLNQIVTCSQPLKAPTIVEQSKYIVANLDQSQSPEPNADLPVIFKLTVAAICLQLLVLTFHYNFLALFTYCMVLYWLFFGYYDQHFVKLLLGMVGFSALMDLIYLFLLVMGKVGTVRQQDQKVFVVLYSVFLGLEVAIRVVLMFKMCLFVRPPIGRQYWMLRDMQIELIYDEENMMIRRSESIR